jgi:GNAT superfamily N-acetyltransferase
MAREPLTLTRAHDADGPDARVIRDRLHAFNAERAGPYDLEEIVLALRDGQAALVAGIIAFTAWGWLNVDYLWVAEAHRGTGLGSRLLGEAERIGMARGCRMARLTTHSFQAPGFYARHGYSGTVITEGYPPGHRLYHMSKPLNR